MEYKISEVVAKTNVPKSTILYYIKEGLLPEAKKIKANVHKYNDEHIELIKYIKYMQESMGSSIEEIKLALEKKNDSFSGSYTMLAPLMSTLSGDNGLEHYTKQDFIENFEIDTELLNKLLADGIVIPAQEDSFTKKDASIITLAEYFLEVGLDYEILKEYIKHAKEIAKLEQKMQKTLCNIKTEENFSLLWKIMFETLFNAKEYIFNRSTYEFLREALKEEIETNK
ncbi:MerR family transcriptional regulator [Sulfurimonas marina]|uniref:MerR family transcriptional regulator n=1 Tax=Sulfurimonas marina TaxID=2590551 RepID=A0A7M1AUS2_9BACT|nr:MerR family transcriptional regulator [Sulfurimonas marina]QOP41191.1 MerR family transcriptional regulator [Sulfurimonas marina]